MLLLRPRVAINQSDYSINLASPDDPSEELTLPLTGRLVSPEINLKYHVKVSV